MKYEIFFFKENTRIFDAEALVAFLLEDENMKMVDKGDQVSIIYKNDLIGLNYSLHFTKVSRVPDLARISPKYLDLDFYIDIDILLPMVKLNVMINLIEKICNHFDFLIYNVLFEGVTHYSRDIITKTYDIVRRGYAEKYQQEYNSLNFINKSKLDGYYRYVLDAKATNEYYNNKYLFLGAYFSKNYTTNEVFVVCDLQLESAIIIPPFIDFIVFERNGVKTLFKANEVINFLGKFVKDFPGFPGNAKMIEEKKIKKIKKLLNKKKLVPIDERIDKVNEGSLIDF